MGDRLATIDMGRTLGAAPLLARAGSPSHTMSPGPRPTSISSGILIHPAVWPQRTWAENWRVVPPFLWGRSWVPIYHNVAWAEAYLHAKFHFGPSNRLAIMHQRHRQTGQEGIGRQTDRQDNGPIAQGEPFYKRSPKNVPISMASCVEDLWIHLARYVAA